MLEEYSLTTSMIGECVRQCDAESSNDDTIDNVYEIAI